MTEPFLALGAMYFGTRLPDAAAFALLDAYVDAGGVWIDTADCYSFWSDPSGRGGQSEAAIGRWLAARPGVRDRVKIGTKVGADPATPGVFQPEEGLGADVVTRVLDESLARLQTDRVDLYWAHVEDRATPLAAVAQSFTDAVAAGKAAAWAVSNHPAWKVERLRAAADTLGRPGPVALQHRYSYFSPLPDRGVAGAANRFGMATPELLDYAREHGLDFWAYTSTLTGAYEKPERLSPEYDHPGTHARSAALDATASELGLSRTAVVIAWLVAHGVRPIIGGSAVEQLRQALDGARTTLSAEQLARLDSAA